MPITYRRDLTYPMSAASLPIGIEVMLCLPSGYLLQRERGEPAGRPRCPPPIELFGVAGQQSGHLNVSGNFTKMERSDTSDARFD